MVALESGVDVHRLRLPKHVGFVAQVFDMSASRFGMYTSLAPKTGMLGLDVYKSSLRLWARRHIGTKILPSGCVRVFGISSPRLDAVETLPPRHDLSTSSLDAPRLEIMASCTSLRVIGHETWASRVCHRHNVSETLDASETLATKIWIREGIDTKTLVALESYANVYRLDA